MDIAPLYELRVRLKHAVISGSDLLSEDFRLKRAVSEMKPLEAASPVFAKIGQLLNVLLSDDCKDRPGVLLDAVTLVDAVICTQGVVTVPGELEEIKPTIHGSAQTNAPYSVLHKLLDALENSGSGRYSYVVETRREHPDLFEDYRVKYGLVKALGANYAELAEEAASWLKESGESVVPLLKEGFDPKGKKEMVRRIQVMEAVAGERENDFYLEQLPEAQKDVKDALIYALRHDKENLECLKELLKTEKGTAKKMAYWALASMDHEGAEEFWTALVKKKPKEAIGYLVESRTSWASDLVADVFIEQIKPWALDGEPILGSLPKKTVEILRACLMALPGKTGEKICEGYRLAAKVGWNLDRPVEGKNVIWSIDDLRPYQGSGTFKGAVPHILLETLRMTGDRDLGETAIEIFNSQEKSQRARWFSAAFTAQILFHTEEECRKWLESFAYKNSVIFGKSISSEEIKREIEKTFRFIWRKKELSQVLKKTDIRTIQNYYLIWNLDLEDQLVSEEHMFDETDNDYVVWMQWLSPVNGRTELFCQPLPWSVEGYLTDLVMDCKDQTLDRHLGHWVSANHPEYCKKLEPYFYKRAMAVVNNRDYLILLRKCGCTRCEGLAQSYFEGKRSISAWEVESYLRELPGGWKEKVKEIKAVRDNIKNGKIRIKNKKIVETFDKYIDELKRTQAGEV